MVGTTALNGELLDNLQGSVKALTAEKRGLEGTITGLRQQTASDQQLADIVGPAAVAGQLTNRSVVLVTAPNASSAAADALVPLVEAAGGTVTGRVQLRPDLLDPTKAAAVDAVVGQVAPQGLDLSQAAPVQRASAELAAALVTGSGEGISTAAAEKVLVGFAQADLVDLTEAPTGRADLAVIVAADPVGSSDPTVPLARARALLLFAEALDTAGSGVVVAGPLAATDEGGAVRALRDDGALSERVSSVDDVDRAQGRLATVYALREQADGRAGRYGSGPGASGPVPSLPAR